EEVRRRKIATLGSTVLALFFTGRVASPAPGLCLASIAGFLLCRNGRTVPATSDHRCSSSLVSARRPRGGINLRPGLPLFIGSTDAVGVHGPAGRILARISTLTGRGRQPRPAEAASSQEAAAGRAVTAYEYRPQPDRDHAAAAAQTAPAGAHARRSDLPRRRPRNRDRRGPAPQWRNRCLVQSWCGGMECWRAHRSPEGPPR